VTEPIGVSVKEQEKMRFQHSAAPNENYTEGVTEVTPIVTVFDDSANDSNKSWVVPAGEMWMLNFAHAILVSSATVGNRVLSLDILDENGNLIIDCYSPANQAASATYHYAYLQGIYRETTFTANSIQVPVPKDLYLKAGYTLKVWDKGAIAAAADDLTVSFQYKRFKGC
jgi:hypothetical protein